jgi:hypothetical protein
MTCCEPWRGWVWLVGVVSGCVPMNVAYEAPQDAIRKGNDLLRTLERVGVASGCG